MSGTRGTVIESSVPADEPYDPEVGEDIASDLPEDAEAAAEARATRMGWTPFAQYRGDPAKWRPASEWLARADEMLPIARAMNHSLETKLKQNEQVINSLTRSVDEQKAVLEDMRRLAQQADQRGHDRAMAEIEKGKRTAVAAGDTEAYDQLVEQAEALDGAREEPAPVPAATPAPPKVSQATQEFVAANKWFTQDQFLTRKMIDQHIDVIQEGEIVDEAEQLAEALARLKTDYPERFNMPAPRQPAPPARQPARRAPARVAAPTPDAPPPRAGATPTINSIADPNERAQAREAFNRTKRQIPDYTEAEYMKLYGDPHADVLEVQRTTKKV